MVSNTIKNLIVKKEVANKLRNEISKGLESKDLRNLDLNQWLSVLNYENLNDISYLTYVINESLRINPPIEYSLAMGLTVTDTINGRTILKEQLSMINIRYLHINPDEWQEPDSFIPDRFDPTSKYYLTPSGKKRHPMSFGPFLGGRRVCLGKTFAESISRYLLTMIICQFEFDFCDEKYYKKLPRN